MEVDSSKGGGGGGKISTHICHNAKFKSLFKTSRMY